MEIFPSKIGKDPEEAKNKKRESHQACWSMTLDLRDLPNSWHFCYIFDVLLLSKL